jgi:hypothetical protein
MKNTGFDAQLGDTMQLNLRTAEKKLVHSHNKLVTPQNSDTDTDIEVDRSCKPHAGLLGQDFYMFLSLLLEVLILLTFAMRRRHAHISIAVAVLVCTQIPFLSSKWHRPPLHVHMFFVHNAALLCVVLAYERETDYLFLLLLIIAGVYAQLASLSPLPGTSNLPSFALSCVGVIMHTALAITALQHMQVPTLRPHSWNWCCSLALSSDVFLYPYVLSVRAAKPL